ncbi:Homeobox domain-like [Propionibacterium ruminifibrarum]|uniref:Homeobox domain-like n=1 Tax=Propionibacterium ruminifibrarum TaxID=1962131 RepID=A0A375I1N4_9ACTN|nr:AraC family transcriptional regulator [Propionibacterium ruminifibrarum]SPF68016.1 Homeobox domain-like [Propionibacterium ruminifibrarum]
MAFFQRSQVGQSGFVPTGAPGFGPGWESFTADNRRLRGLFHSFAPDDAEWAITIHDFALTRDSRLRFELPHYLTACWFESIAGRQLTPRRPLRANSIWGHWTGDGLWEGIVRGAVPIRAVSIEVSPTFSARFLDAEYPGQFRDVADAFRCLGLEDDFPDLKNLLAELWPQPHDAPRGRLHYEAKVLEAMGMIVEHTRGAAQGTRLRRADVETLHAVVAYIDEHLDRQLRIDELSRMACMSPTKFKADFRAANGCTVGQYIQASRMSRAEVLLRHSDMTIGQVGRQVGYHCASRFSQLFKREKGMLPSEFRRARTQPGAP